MLKGLDKDQHEQVSLTLLSNKYVLEPIYFMHLYSILSSLV